MRAKVLSDRDVVVQRIECQLNKEVTDENKKWQLHLDLDNEHKVFNTRPAISVSPDEITSRVHLKKKAR